MKILALDTASEACSVALWQDGAVLERFELVQQGHSQRLLPMLDELLATAQCSLSACDAIAFGRGPGSFTSLRIGAGVTQGLAFGAGLPVVPVSSLAALAQGQDGDRVLAALDARMEQVYWAPFVRNEHGLMQPRGAELVTAPQAVQVDDGGWTGAGSGWDRYGDALRLALGDTVNGWNPGQFPRAAQVAILAVTEVTNGNLVTAEEAVPRYVRDDVAQKARR